jgi:hypothetical protein
MTPTEANTVAAFAKGLFPVTSDERITSLATMVLNFPNEAFARQCLLEHSQNSDVLSIPAVRGMLEAEETRRRETAIQRQLAVTDAQRQQELRRSAEQSRIALTWAPVNELLDAMTDADLADLKADAVKTFPFMAKSDPRTHKGLRAVMYERLAKGRGSARSQAVASNSVAQLASDFDA